MTGKFCLSVLIVWNGVLQIERGWNNRCLAAFVLVFPPSRLIMYYLKTPPRPRLFVPPAERERGSNNSDYVFFFLLNLLSVCWRVCVSTLFVVVVLSDPSQSQLPQTLGNNKLKAEDLGGARGICAHLWTETLPSHLYRHSSRFSDFFLPRARSSPLASRPAAQNQWGFEREGCRQWNAAVFLFFGLLLFLVPVQFKAQVSSCRLWIVQSHIRTHQYWS